jgi:hypothetical protein
MDSPDTHEIDLPPHKWQSDRPKPKEPFFGKGAPEWIAYIVSLTITLTIVHYFVK